MDWTLTYCHKAIDSARPHFRLLKLLPAEPLGNGLRCTLDTHSFPPENVEYEALSYTWGKGPKRFRLFVDDDTFAITQNLYNALRRLRHEYKIRTLWIDAICIDQSNSHEKNQQVQFMRDVFANASTVLIWLGESNPAIETMMACSEAQDFVCSRKYKWTDEARRGMSHLIPGALCLLTKDWFNRMWTMQEFLVAKDTRLLCGSGSMLWRSFREMLIPLQDTSPSMTFNGRTRLMEDNLDKKPFGRELYSIMKLEESRKLLDFVPPKGEEEQDVWSLDALLELTVTREATDPRDKIFALLGLVSSRKLVVPLFGVDYTIPLGLVCQKASVFIFESRECLDWLIHAISQGTLTGIDKPSWSIDFSQAKWNDIEAQPWCRFWPLGRYLPSPGHRVEGLKLKHDPLKATITVSGVELGRVEEVSEMFPAKARYQRAWEEDPYLMWPILDILRKFSNSAYTALARRLGKDGAARKLAAGCVWRTAIAGYRYLPSEHIGNDALSSFPALEKATLTYIESLYFNEGYDDYIEYIVPPWDDSLPNLPAETSMQDVIGIVMFAIIQLSLETGHSCLFATDSGYIGLSGSPLRKDDRVCVLVGCPFPVVLRCVEGGMFRVVAYTYVDDMDAREFFSQDEVVGRREFVLR